MKIRLTVIMFGVAVAAATVPKPQRGLTVVVSERSGAEDAPVDVKEFDFSLEIGDLNKDEAATRKFYEDVINPFLFFQKVQNNINKKIII